MLTSLGVAIELSKKDLDVEVIKQTPILYIEGYLWDSPTAREACLEAIKIAKENGNKVAFTYSDGFCVDRHKQDFIELAQSKVDILFCNESEAKAATNHRQAQHAFEEMCTWTDMLFVSTGPKGCLVSADKGKQKEEVPTWDAKLVDKLGAGDLFASGVLFGLKNNKSLKECAYLGCFSATRVIQQMSARLDDSLSKQVEVALKGPGANAA
jgi:sugar/nucleoside kinase (ribokinase family)